MAQSINPQTSPDRSLLRLLGQARRFQAMVMRGDVASITALAEEAGIGPSYTGESMRRPSAIAVLHVATQSKMMFKRHKSINGPRVTRRARRYYFTRVLKLSFLSPALVEAIVEGRQPAGLNARSLTRDASQLASAWSAQAVQLRFI